MHVIHLGEKEGNKRARLDATKRLLMGDCYVFRFILFQLFTTYQPTMTNCSEKKRLSLEKQYIPLDWTYYMYANRLGCYSQFLCSGDLAISLTWHARDIGFIGD